MVLLFGIENKKMTGSFIFGIVIFRAKEKIGNVYKGVIFWVCI